MYSLLGRVKNGQVELCSKMAEYVKKRGKVIMINPEKRQNYSPRVVGCQWEGGEVVFQKQ